MMEVWELVARESIRDRIARYVPPGERPSIRHFANDPWIVFESQTRAGWLITGGTVTTEGVDPEDCAAVPA